MDYRIYKSYQVEGKIGKGVYGEVYKVKEKITEKPFAIKKIIDAFQNLTDAKRTYRELSYQLQLSHPCIVKLDKVIIGEPDEVTFKTGARNVYAVLEIMELDLAKALKNLQLETLQRKYIAMQLLFGLSYLHSSELIHRDIKPSNILVNLDCSTKICDFGLVRMANDFQNNKSKSEQIFTEYIASKWYRAPEVMLSGNNASTYAIDIWSAGCVLAEMILGEPLFSGNNNIEQLERIFMVIGIPIDSEIERISSENGKYLMKNFRNLKRTLLTDLLCEKAKPEEIDLITQMLLFDPVKRITAKDALNHPYFAELSEEKENFKFYPVQIVDHSLKREETSLQLYKELIEGLCVSTKRGMSAKSKESLLSNLSSKNTFFFESTKNDDLMQEKSTRESHSGLLKKYKDQKEQHNKDELNKKEESKENPKGIKLKRKRNVSNQSISSIGKKEKNVKSKPKLSDIKSSQALKTLKSVSKIGGKVDVTVKIVKKNKKRTSEEKFKKLKSQKYLFEFISK